jgi:hypothetical protein
MRAAPQDASRAHAETSILAESARFRKHSSTEAAAVFAVATQKIIHSPRKYALDNP